MQVKTEKLPEVVLFQDYPHSPEDAAQRVRSLVQKLNVAINNAKKFHNLTTTLHVHKVGAGIERVSLQKEY